MELHETSFFASHGDSEWLRDATELPIGFHTDIDRATASPDFDADSPTTMPDSSALPDTSPLTIDVPAMDTDIDRATALPDFDPDSPTMPDSSALPDTSPLTIDLTTEEPAAQKGLALQQLRHRLAVVAKFALVGAHLKSGQPYEIWNLPNRTSLGLYDVHDAVVHKKRATDSFSLFMGFYVCWEKLTRNPFVIVGIGSYDTYHRRFLLLLREATFDEQNNCWKPVTISRLTVRSHMSLENDIKDLKLVAREHYPRFESDLTESDIELHLIDPISTRLRSDGSPPKGRTPTKAKSSTPSTVRKPKPRKPPKVRQPSSPLRMMESPASQPLRMMESPASQPLRMMESPASQPLCMMESPASQPLCMMESPACQPLSISPPTAGQYHADPATHEGITCQLSPTYTTLRRDDHSSHWNSNPRLLPRQEPMHEPNYTTTTRIPQPVHEQPTYLTHNARPQPVHEQPTYLTHNARPQPFWSQRQLFLLQQQHINQQQQQHINQQQQQLINQQQQQLINQYYF